MSDAFLKDIQALHERNRRVDAAKAWEISLFRRGLLTLFTYGMVFLFMKVVGLEPALFGACVPAGAYLISTLTVGPLRDFWIRHVYKRRSS